MKMFQAKIDAEVQSTSLSEFLRKSDSLAPARARLSLPWSAAPHSQDLPQSSRLKWTPQRQANLVDSGDDVKIEALGSVFTFSKVAIPLLLDLIECRSTMLGDLCERHGELNVSDIVMDLISSGLVAIVSNGAK